MNLNKFFLKEKRLEDFKDNNGFFYNCSWLCEQERAEELEKYKEHIKKYIK